MAGTRYHCKTKKHTKSIKPLAIGYNVIGADDVRTVLYRNFQEVTK